MFRKNTQVIADLRARVRFVIDERDDARADARQFLSAVKLTAARNLRLTDKLTAALARTVRQQTRIVRLVHTVARLRQEVAAETRRADLLQARLDDAVGITSPAVDAGAMWQQHRTDKPTPKAAS
ncbi:hypothetical protein ACWCPT_05925 [Streptomyces sp. NPDC002308]